MKSILLSGTAAILLVAASGAYAAQPDDHQTGHPDAGTHDTHTGGDNHMGAPPSDQHGATTGDHNAMGDHHDNATTATHTHHTRHHRSTTSGATHRDETSADHRSDDHGGTHHAQIDVKFRIAVTATHHFHAGEYRSPPGYAYRRYNIGERLEPTFYARDYWLTDYATYDLMAPPDGYVWVRFGPDAILIDQDTGEVVQVQYGIFD